MNRVTLLLSLLLLATAPMRSFADDFRLMAFGDSLVHGFGLPVRDSFPSQLQAALREHGWKVEVLNAGNSGDTTAAGLARLDWALADHPQAAIVVFGANDGLRGLDPAETRANLDAILKRLAEAKVPALLAGMYAPRNLGKTYIEAFDSLYPALAATHDVVFYPFFLEGVVARPAFNQADGLHPNAEGVAYIVREMLPKVEELLRRAGAPRSGHG